MAGKGTYGAYTALKGVGEQTVQNLKDAERAGFHYRREETERKERKQKRLKETADMLGVGLDAMSYDNTGVQSVDKPVVNYLIKSKKEITELASRLTENPDDTDAYLRFQNIVNSAKTIKGFTETYGAWMQDYKKGIAEGTYSEYLNKGLPEKINENLLAGNYSIFNDKNGQANLFVDLDGDGELDDDFKVINLPGFISGQGLNGPAQRTYAEDVVKDLSDNFGTADITTENGLTQKRVKGFDPENMGALRTEIDNRMGATVEEMTPAAMSILADGMGMDPKSMTEEDFQDFKEQLATKVVSRVDRIDTTDVDNNLALQREKFEYDKTQDAIENARKDAGDDEETPEPTNDIQLNTDETGNYKTEEGFTKFSLPEDVTVDNITARMIEKRGNQLVLYGVRKTKDSYEGTTYEDVKLDGDSRIKDFVKNITNPDTGRPYRNLKEFKDRLDMIEANGVTTQREGYGSTSDLPPLD